MAAMGWAGRLRIPPRSSYDPAPLARFDAFLFAAAATVLVTRLILFSSGYPQVGGGRLHIAHVLYGGLLLGLALTVMMCAITGPARFWASLVGGIGFGLFIDEVGKFVTRDVDYFFRPTFAIIYGVLLASYLIGREFFTRRQMTDARARAIAAQAVASGQLGGLSRQRRDTALQLLADSTPTAQTATIRRLLETVETQRARTFEELLTSIANRSRTFLVHAATKRWVRRLVFALMTIQAVLSVGELVLVALAHFNDDVRIEGITLDIGTFVGLAVQTALILAGLVVLARHHPVAGFQLIRAGLYVALLYTTIMKLGAEQSSAVRDFIVVSILLVVVRSSLTAATAAERPSTARPASASPDVDPASFSTAPAGGQPGS